MTATRVNPHYRITPDYANSTQYSAFLINPSTWKYTATAPTIVYLSAYPINMSTNVVAHVNGWNVAYAGFDYSAHDSKTMTNFTVILGVGDVLTLENTNLIWVLYVPLV